MKRAAVKAAFLFAGPPYAVEEFRWCFKSKCGSASRQEDAPPALNRDEGTGEHRQGRRRPVHGKDMCLSQKMDGEIGAATGADLDRGNFSVRLTDKRLPGNESIKGVPDFQLVTALAKPFLHDCLLASRRSAFVYPMCSTWSIDKQQTGVLSTKILQKVCF